jgi:hypothetical protein
VAASPPAAERERRQALDVVERLVRRHAHAADPFPEGGPHHRHDPGCADRHRAPRAIDLVVAAGRRADGRTQVRELLREDLLERPVRREQAVAHHQRLLAALDHLALHAPVVVALLLLRAGGQVSSRARATAA